MTLPSECSFAWDGAALFILLAAIPVAAALTFTTLWLYRRAIDRAMRSAARDGAPNGAEPPVESIAPAAELQIMIESSVGAAAPAALQSGARAHRRLNGVLALAGAVHAALSVTIMFLLNDIGFAPLRTFMIWFVLAWPIVIVFTMTGAKSRRRKWQVIAAYFAALLLLEVITETFGLRYQPNFGELFLFWGLVMGPPTLVVAIFVNRAWRAVGLIALCVALAIIGALVIGFQVVGCTALAFRSTFLLDVYPYLVGLALMAAAALTWWLLRRSARRYDARLGSDQLMIVNSLWLLCTALEVLFEMGTSGAASLWFLAAYAGYRVVLAVGMRAIHPRDAESQALLLLRVFGHERRARTLADQIGQVWRHTGCINMIGGTDLATSLIEPDELLSFWSGRTRERFVAGPADLEHRLKTLNERRDPDGRFRINEFFCHDNTWRATVAALAQRSAVVLMDLRGFGRANRGCEFELEMLLGAIPLARIVLVFDDTTRLDELVPLLESAWTKISADSPNHALSRPVLALQKHDDTGSGLDQLMRRLYAASAVEHPGASRDGHGLAPEPRASVALLHDPAKQAEREQYQTR
jgi:hypothetical protein